MDIANVASRDLLLGGRALAELQESFQGELLSANVEVDGEPLFATHTVVERQIDGKTVRIGVTGVTLKSRTAQETWEQGELSFSDPMQAARKMAETLRPQTDFRILLANMAVADLENFVAEFPDAYQLVVSGNGDLRNTTPLGVPPFVLAPGTSGKTLAWVNVKLAERAPSETPAADETPRQSGDVAERMAFEVTTGNTLTLDETIRDDPETAALVEDYGRRMRQHLQNRSRPETSQNDASTGRASLAVPASGH